MIKQLLKIRFLALMSGTQNEKKSRAKKSIGIVGITLLALALGALFMFMLFTFAFPLGTVLIPNGLSDIYFTLFAIMAFFLVLILSSLETKSQLFDCKDNELLLSMPIKTSDILVSRTLTVMILNYLEMLIVAIPTLVVYAIVEGKITVMISATVAFLCIPLSATAISGLFGYFLTYIEKKFKNSNYLIIAFQLLFIGLYFYFMFFVVNDKINQMSANPEEFLIEIELTFEKFAFIGEVFLFKPANFFIFIVLSVLVFFAFVLFVSKNYIKIITSKVKMKKVAYNSEKELMAKSSVFLSLLKKEFSKITSCSVLLVNGLVGALLQIGFAIVTLTNSNGLLENLTISGFSKDFVIVPMCLISFAFGSINVIGSSIVSLEGKNFWLIKTSPVNMKTLVLAKFTASFVFSAVPSFISSILFFFATGADTVYIVFFLLIAILSSFLITAFSLAVNIMMPKFDFTSEAEVVKRSGAVNVSTLSMMLFSLIILIGSTFLTFVISPILSLTVVASVFAVICAILAYALVKPLSNRLEKMDV